MTWQLAREQRLQNWIGYVTTYIMRLLWPEIPMGALNYGDFMSGL
jgi:hypothetical protein